MDNNINMQGGQQPPNVPVDNHKERKNFTLGLCIGIGSLILIAVYIIVSLWGFFGIMYAVRNEIQTGNNYHYSDPFYKDGYYYDDSDVRSTIPPQDTYYDDLESYIEDEKLYGDIEKVVTDRHNYANFKYSVLDTYMYGLDDVIVIELTLNTPETLEGDEAISALNTEIEKDTGLNTVRQEITDLITENASLKGYDGYITLDFEYYTPNGEFIGVHSLGDV